jgi:SAM-dependent methyltransferase
VLFDWDDTSVLKCDKCGLVFRKVAIELSEGELFAFAGRIGDASKSPTAKYDVSYTEDDSRVVLWKGFLKELEKFKLSRDRKLLDIGSSKGVFLDIARKSGWEVMGVEPSDSDSAYAREVFGLPVFTGTLEEAGFPSNCFDVVTMWDVIEHLKNPTTTVAQAFHVLKPGGLISVLTPNHDSLITILSHFVYKLTARRFPLERLLYPVVHLYYFTPKTLSDLLSRSGFNIVRVGSAPLHPEKCLISTGIVRTGASVIDFVAKPLNKSYRIAIIASKPSG